MLVRWLVTVSFYSVQRGTDRIASGATPGLEPGRHRRSEGDHVAWLVGSFALQVALNPLNGRWWPGHSQLDLIFLAFLSFWG